MNKKWEIRQRSIWFGLAISCSLLILFALPQTTRGQQWTSAPPNIYYNGGNVGIGTTSPSDPLHLSSASGVNIRSTDSTYNTSSYLTQVSQWSVWAINRNPITGAKPDTNRTAAQIFFQAMSGDSSIHFHTSTTNGADPTERMVIDKNGNVGIGTTTNLFARLTTAQSGTATSIGSTTGADVGLALQNTDTTPGNMQAISFQNNSGAGQGGLGVINVSSSVLAGGRFFIWTRAAGGAPTERLRVDESGNVGIGTASPSTVLHVRKDQNATTAVRIENQTAGTAAATNIHVLNDLGNAAQIGIVSSATNAYGAIAANNANLYTSSPGLVLMADTASGIIKFATGGNSEKVRIDANGNVGIGTTSPGYKLDVAGAINAAGLNINGSPVTGSQWATSGTTINYGAGNVGIGTSTPGSKLDVTGNINASGTINAVGGLNINGSPVTSSQWATSGTTINYGGGNVGIGTTTPGYKLDVNGTVNATGVNVNGSPITSSQWTTSGSNINYATSGGNVGVGQANPAYKLDVNGTAHVSGNMTVDGNLAAKYQDLAEWVPASEQLPTGTVVVLDPTKTNQVIASTVSYDTRVAGVVSDQPGIALGERGANKVLVATTGRVRVKVDATRAPIHVGDLLVTSDVPGVAMKSEPVNIGGVQLHRPGTLIGKALEPLAKGSGEILVLLSLQ